MVAEKKDGKEYLLNHFERIEESYKIPVIATSVAMGAVAAGILGPVGGLIGCILGSGVLGQTLSKDDKEQTICLETKHDELATSSAAGKGTARNLTAEDIPEDLFDDSTLVRRKLFCQKLFQYEEQIGLTDVQLYTRAHISKAVFSKIRGMMRDGTYRPSKVNVICLCIALNLEVKQAEEMLNLLEYSFSNADRLDRIVHWCLCNTEFYFTVDSLNEIFYDKLGETLLPV